jgi:phytoene dehydrogenase-like protein
VSYDVIIVGAGHNGLVCATRLAQAGRRVLVLERRSVVGGVAAGEEFHPGYRHVGLLHDSVGVRPEVIADLKLDVRTRVAPKLHGVNAEGGFALGSAEDLRPYRDRLARIRDFTLGLLRAPAPRIDASGGVWPVAKAALSFRLLGDDEMMSLLRIGPISAEDFLSEWVSHPQTRALLAAPGLVGTWMGPQSPTSAATLMLEHLTRFEEVEGGPAALVVALVEAAEKAGVEIRTNVEVTRIRLAAGSVVGVATTEGETFDAPRVATSCDPKKTALDLVPPLACPPMMEEDARCIRTRGTLAKVHLALRGPPSFCGLFEERMHTAQTTLELERAFDAVKFREIPKAPPLDIRVPTLVCPDLAPSGHHVLSVAVHAVPFELDAGWTDETREALWNQVRASLTRFSPGILDLIVAKEVLSPADIATRYGLTGGHVYGGEHAIDQLYISRPTLAQARHATQIPGLFLCSSGTHPGGGITGAPGYLSAAAILEAGR